MKLSDSIVMGSTVIGETDSHTYCGCALAMGLIAVGGQPCERVMASDKLCDDYADASIEWERAALEQWPWLGDTFTVPPQAIGHRYICYSIGGRACAIFIISALFSRVEAGLISLDCLIEWVRANEPAEELQSEILAVPPEELYAHLL
jgi:hypothetical protein